MDMNDLVGQVSEVERLIRTRKTKDLAEVMRSLQRIMCEATGAEVRHIEMIPEERPLCADCSAKGGDCASGDLRGGVSCDDARERIRVGHQRESARWLRQDMERLTHRHYNVEEALAGLNIEALHELRRFVKDAEFEADLKARKASLQPWRRP